MTHSTTQKKKSVLRLILSGVLTAAMLVSLCACSSGNRINIEDLIREQESGTNLTSQASEPVSSAPAQSDPQQDLPEPQVDPVESFRNALNPMEGYEDTAGSISMEELGLKGRPEDIYVIGDKLLIRYTDQPMPEPGEDVEMPTSSQLVLYDPATDSIVAKDSILFSDITMGICAGDEGFVSSNGRVLSVYDDKLQLQASYTLPENDFSEYYVTPDLKKVYFWGYSDSRTPGIYAANLKDAIKLEPKRVFEKYMNAELKTVSRNSVIFSYLTPAYRTELCAASVTNDAVILSLGQNTCYSAYQYGNTYMWDSSSGNSDMLFYVKEKEEEKIFVHKDSIITANGSPYLLSASYTEAGNNYTCYDMNGNFRESILFDQKTGSPFGPPQYMDAYGCLVYRFTYPDNTHGLFFWFPGDEDGDPLEEGSSEKPAPQPPEKLKYLYDQIAVLENTYGIKILIGEEAAIENGTYTVIPMTDEDTIYEALNIFGETLAKFPDDFFRQLPYGSYDTLTFALSGDIISEQSGALSSAGGYVSEDFGYLHMVIDADCVTDIPWLFYHEISHLIDRRLNFAASANPDEILFNEDDWMALQPEGFSYVGDYAVYENGSETNEAYDRWSDYFTSPYATTFATEDRAELMRHAIYDAITMPDDPQAWTVRTNAPMNKKYSYYVKCIREVFDTTDWPAVTVWEKAVK